jgi:hypothetical protein
MTDVSEVRTASIIRAIYQTTRRAISQKTVVFTDVIVRRVIFILNTIIYHDVKRVGVEKECGIKVILKIAPRRQQSSYSPPWETQILKVMLVCLSGPAVAYCLGHFGHGRAHWSASSYVMLPCTALRTADHRSFLTKWLKDSLFQNHS